MLKLRPNFIHFVIIITFTILLIHFLKIVDPVAYSQKVILPESYHIQNNSVVILPFLYGETTKTYKPEFNNFKVKHSSFILSPSNGSISYTITNAKFTVIEKVSTGKTKADSIVPKQINVLNDKKIINGKK